MKCVHPLLFMDDKYLFPRKRQQSKYKFCSVLEYWSRSRRLMLHAIASGDQPAFYSSSSPITFPLLPTDVVTVLSEQARFLRLDSGLRPRKSPRKVAAGGGVIGESDLEEEKGCWGVEHGVIILPSSTSSATSSLFLVVRRRLVVVVVSRFARMCSSILWMRSNEGRARGDGSQHLPIRRAVALQGMSDKSGLQPAITTSS